MFADLLKEGGDKPLTNEVFCELGKVGTSASQGVGFRLLQRALPDSIVVSASIGGDEGCARVYAQDVSVDSKSYATMEEAKAAHQRRRRKKVSLKAIKKDPIAMAKLTDHVFVLLKVETDEGRPGCPYSQWGRKAFVDEESAAQNAKKLYKKCLWAEDSESSDDGGEAKGRSHYFLGFALDDSDCGDYTQDLSKMEDDIVIFDYGTSIRINKVMLPLPLPPGLGAPSAQGPAHLPDQAVHAALVGKWTSKKGTCRILKDPTTASLAYEELLGDGVCLHGLLNEVQGDHLLLQATLGILENGQDAALGISEVVGRIRVRLVAPGGMVGGRDTKGIMETQIHVDGKEAEGDEWEATVRFYRNDEDEV